MTPDHARALARYNRWMNEKVYDAASRLNDDDRKRDRGAFFKSIHATLNHLLLADRIWMGRFAGVVAPQGSYGPGIQSLDQELCADFGDLRRERTKTDDALATWVDELTEAKLASTLSYAAKTGPFACPLWWAVAHLFNHQTHHRGQVTTLLTQAGVDVGVTDLFAMLRAERTG